MSPQGQLVGAGWDESVRELFSVLSSAPDAHKLMGDAWSWFNRRAGIDVLGVATLGPPEPIGYLFAEGPLDSPLQDELWEELVRSAVEVRSDPGTHPRRTTDLRVWRGPSTFPIVLMSPTAAGPWTIELAGAPAVVVQGWRSDVATIDPTVDAILPDAAVFTGLFLRNVQLLDCDPTPDPAGDLTFEELLEREVSRARRTYTAMSLALIEFRLGDQHPLADECPPEIQEEVRRIVVSGARSGDYVVSISDCCLAVVMPKTDARGAMVGADRLQRTLQEHFGGRTPEMSVRMGIGGRDPEETQASELFARASQALAQARIAHGEAAFLHI